MITNSSFLSLPLSCPDALQIAKANLARAGMQALQTFDLQTARLAMPDCSCPNHGTAACDCQMVVLLVYGAKAEPATLILHGNDGHTWFSIAETPNQETNFQMTTAIKNALEGKLPA